MMRLRNICFCVCLALATTRAPAADDLPATYANPLDVILADPFALRVGDTYYLYATSDPAGVRVWTSANLVDWRNRGFAFRKGDDDYGQRRFWAPEAFAHNGKFYLHYTASPLGKSQRIVLAESESPLGPFKEVKGPWFESDLCVIDSHVFKDDDGRMYLYYVVDCSENTISEIYVRPISDELIVSKEAAFCVKPSQSWEGTKWNEAPFVFKHGKTYFLTYSANCYVDTIYNVGYATAPSPMGPWAKADENPVLRHTKDVSGPGHNALIDSPDGKERFALYHTHQRSIGGGKRQLALDAVRIVEAPGKPPRLMFDGPTVSPRPIPSGGKPLALATSEDFSATKLGESWTCFNESPEHWSLDGGWLTIQTREGEVVEQHSDLSNLFLQRCGAGNFTITTRVDFPPGKDPRQGSLYVSLYVWQDHNNFARLSLLPGARSPDGARIELRVEAARETDGKLAGHIFHATGERYLRIQRTGDKLTFLISPDGEKWRSLDAVFDGRFNETKVGIAASSTGSTGGATARFDFFHIDTGEARR